VRLTVLSNEGATDLDPIVHDLIRTAFPGKGRDDGVYDLFDAAVSDFLGRPVRARSALSFTTETGTAVLEAEFSGVILHRHEVPPGIPLGASARRLPQ
jgi:hypothetical protein